MNNKKYYRTIKMFGKTYGVKNGSRMQFMIEYGCPVICGLLGVAVTYATICIIVACENASLL